MIPLHVSLPLAQVAILARDKEKLMRPHTTNEMFKLLFGIDVEKKIKVMP